MADISSLICFFLHIKKIYDPANGMTMQASSNINKLFFKTGTGIYKVVKIKKRFDLKGLFICTFEYEDCSPQITQSYTEIILPALNT
jgi:hypothetical protein